MKKTIKTSVATFVVTTLTIVFVFCGCNVDTIEGTPAETASIETTITTEVTTDISTAISTTAVTTVETTADTTLETAVSTTEETIVETKEKETEEIKTEKPAETNIAKPETTAAPAEYLVYKPSTHYIHRSTCRWNSGDAYKVDCTTELVARLCDECNPEISDYIEYVEPEVDYSILSDYEKTCLAVMLCHECSPRAGAAHNAHSVAAMVNRVKNGSSSSIYSAISSSCSPYWEYGHGSWCMDGGCMNGMDSSYAYDAINYYIANSSDYSWVTGWYASGDGIYNVYH